MDKKIMYLMIAVVVAIVVGFGVYALYFNEKNQEVSEQPNDVTNEEITNDNPEEQKDFEFGDARKSAHYVSNTPAHGQILSEVPNAVTITFDFDLAENSRITVTKGGEDVASGSTVITGDSLVLSQSLKQGSGSGLYKVEYSACWPDGSCHEGSFAFGVKDE